MLPLIVLALTGCPDQLPTTTQLPAGFAQSSWSDTGQDALGEAEAEATLQAQVLPQLEQAHASALMTDALSLLQLAWATCGHVPPQGPATSFTTNLDCEGPDGRVYGWVSRVSDRSEQHISETMKGDFRIYRDGERVAYLDGELRTSEWLSNGQVTRRESRVDLVWLMPRGVTDRSGYTDVAMDLEWHSRADGVQLRADGYAHLPGVLSFTAEDLTLVVDETCPEPAGALGYRDADGSWYLAAFDGLDSTSDTGTPSCDGCGALTRTATPMGEVCLDFSALMEQPW